MNPLSASEVRRRGTRLRRRNTALATIGVAAVAVIAMPLGLSAAGGDRSAPEPGPATQSPTRTSEPVVTTDWRQEVPATFPLAEGFPTTNASDGSPVVVSDEPGLADVTLCGLTAWSADSAGPVPAADAAGVTYAGESEDSRARTLAVYADDHAAEQAFTDLRLGVVDCPVDRTWDRRPPAVRRCGRRSPASRPSRSPSAPPRRRRLPGRPLTYQVVRVGNAVYLATYVGQGGGDQQVVDQALQLMAEDSAPVISDLCLFAAEPCGPTDGDPSEGSGSGGSGAEAATVN